MTETSTGVSADLISVAVRSIHAMADGERAEFDALYHPAATDQENRIQPPTSRVQGPDCFWSTAQWLRAAFAGLHYDVHHALTDGELVVVSSTMNGEHAQPWAVYTESGEIDTVFPPTHRSFAMTQSHWFRMQDGVIIEHWANRDDLGMARQLGWVPPSPAFLLRMALAKRKARRAG
jgi:predicted ester cyclase